MKRSDKLAIGATGFTAAVGIGAALFFPLGGLIAGAYFTYGAVAATMGTGATVALTAAGAVGGLVLGKIARPIAMIGSVAVAGMVGGLTKIVTGLLDRSPRGNGRVAPEAQQTVHGTSAPKGSFKTNVRLTAKFGAGKFKTGKTPVANQDKPAVKADKTFRL